MNINRDPQFTRLTIRMLGVYTQMHKVLGGLPVPVLVATPNMELMPSEMIDSASQARETLGSILMHREARAILKTAVTDWLTATVLMATGSNEHAGAPWAYAAAMLAFDRAAEEFDRAVLILHGEE
ncbi:hypothetical protein ACPESR_25370 [Nocardia testacea]|uniref:hypothetical protein n=1 Tax=Nocardia testacea TaxID=248551 RepID=UPI003C2AB0CA